MSKIKISEYKEEKYELHGKLRKLMVLYFSTTTSMDEGIDKCLRYDRSIQSFSASDCKIMFEFKKNISGANKHEIAKVFGRDWSAKIRAYKYFIEHMYINFKHLVMDNLQWWYLCVVC